MGGARDARIVISDHLLAPPCQLLFRQAKEFLHVVAKILLDTSLVLGGRWNNFRLREGSGRLDPVAVIEQSPGGLGAGVPGRVASGYADRGFGARLISLDDAQGLVTGIQEFDAPDDDPFERISADRP